MSSPIPNSAPPSARTRAVPLGAAAVFAATALVDLVGRPEMDAPRHHLSGTAAYVFTAMLLPFAAATVAVAWWLRSGQPERRPVRLGTWLVAVGAAGFWACGLGSLATANSRFGGPLYPAAMLASLIGLSILAVISVRVRTVRAWAAVALPLAWVIGGPIGEGQFFRGAALVLAAATAGLVVDSRPAPTADARAAGHEAVSAQQ